MLLKTDTPLAPWYIVNADDNRRARLNCISHLLNVIPYEEVKRDKVKLPDRQKAKGYKEPTNRSYKKGAGKILSARHGQQSAKQKDFTDDTHRKSQAARR